MRYALYTLFFTWAHLTVCSFFGENPISIASEVAAGTSVEASLSADFHNGATKYIDYLRIYLATSTKADTIEEFHHSDCNLIHELSTCSQNITFYDDYIDLQNLTFKVTIPASVGPSGPYYVLEAQLFQTDGSWYSGSVYSNIFNLTGATGTWGDYRSRGYTLWGDDGIPCTGYACVQNCSDAAWEEYEDTGYNGDNSTKYHNCVNSCPSVSVNWSSSYGGQPTASLTVPTSCALNQATSTSDFTPTGTVTTKSTASVAPTSGSNAADIVDLHYALVLGFFVSLLHLGSIFSAV